MDLLSKIDLENPPTDAEVREVLEKEIPQFFGPSEESFYSLCREIESFKSWRAKKKEEKPIIPVPSNISANAVTQDSITLTWDDDWRASSYQIEVDGSKILERFFVNTFSKGGLFPDTEHTFRVRALHYNGVSEWSDVIKGRTSKKYFQECVWKKCPDDADWRLKYSIDEKNPRIATKTCGGGNYRSTIIGNAPIPPSKVTSWNIKILKSRWNSGGGIFIGVAPFDISQKEVNNLTECGWRIDCGTSFLYSGPPHRYWNKGYGPSKRIQTGDSVGVVMDMTKGKLSFALNLVNHGVAYEGIPLDKPLVPCVLLEYEGDSIELVI